VGGSSTAGSGFLRVFLWDKGVMTDLGFSGAARAINPAGQLVGRIFINGGGLSHATLWTRK
jgi:uncharacterized membrane protein